MEGLFNVVPAEMDLLNVQEVYDILENCQQLVNLAYDWEFVLFRNPVYYKWCELPEDSDGWEHLYEAKKKSGIYKNVKCVSHA